MNFKPLLITGIARGGTNLVGRMLNAHPSVTVAIDPFLPSFKVLRNSIFETSGHDLRGSLDPNLLIQDYYYQQDRIQSLDLVQSGNLQIGFPKHNWSSIQSSLAARAKHECPDFIPHLNFLVGESFYDFYTNAFQLINQLRGHEESAWVGFKDLWTIEFFPLFSRSYPDSKFVVIVRDPRAIAASILAYLKIDPLQVAHILSVLRHWRKSIAFTQWLQTFEDWKKKLYVVRYESLVSNPEKEARALCEFLSLPFDHKMLETNKYYDVATQGIWTGNSSYSSPLQGIDVKSINRWQESLDSLVLSLIEYTCEAEMKLSGYDLVDNKPGQSIRALEAIMESCDREWSWRSDFRDPLLDFGYEAFRRTLLKSSEKKIDQDTIRKAFLFSEAFHVLRTV